MSNIVKKYLRVLEVISSLNCELEFKSGVGRKEKMSDLEVVALSLTAEFMSIDSENSLFKEINNQQIPDHLGTSTALTDFNGNAYQFFLNLPFGEIED